jgi:2-polyprenyl-3-methyl-5-hydroxy-6-metoxy-1,4-benzoquinol methylase
MNPPFADVLEQRLNAAELSGGISSDVIYSMIERVILRNGLRGKILDYGAGIGSLTRRLLALQRFDQVAAADIMPAPDDLAASVDWITQDLNDPIPDHRGVFDIVVAAEVIEHLENPRLAMRQIFRVLRPRGTVIVTTPNNESWRSLIALLVQGHYVLFGDTCYPAHITALLRKDLTRIFQEARFTAPQFLFSDSGGIPGQPLIQWQTVSCGLLRGLRFSDNILAVAKKLE